MSSLSSPPRVHIRYLYHHVWSPGDRMGAMASSSYTLWFVHEGEIRILTESARMERPLEANAGDLVLLGPTAGRSYHTPLGAAWHSLGFTLSRAAAQDAFRGFALPCRWQAEESERRLLTELLTRLCAEHPPTVWRPDGSLPPSRAESAEVDPVSDLIRDSCAYAIATLCWASLSRRAGPPADAAPLPESVRRVRERLIAEPYLSLGDMAAIAGVSPVQLRRLFRRHLDITPQEYLLRLRLEAARRLLQTTDQTVQDIAYQVGFESLHYFTRRFHQAFGAPPGQYRKQSI